MAKIIWDADGDRLYETGVRHGVLYVRNDAGTYPTGVAWNGLTSVSESPEGAEVTALYADDMKYLNLISAEEFKATVEAYTYPDEFAECDGSASLVEGMTIGQQTRKTFGLCYRTVVGNDVLNNEYGYKIHLIYGCLAAPSEKSYETINDSPEAITFSWELSTTPVAVSGHKPTASVVIDSTKMDADDLAVIEASLYGADAVAFDATKAYKAGDAVTQSNKTYIAKQAISAGTFDATKWVEVSDVGPHLLLPDELLALIA